MRKGEIYTELLPECEATLSFMELYQKFQITVLHLDAKESDISLRSQ